jgi:pyruvate formate lyase activating enzyme
MLEELVSNEWVDYVAMDIKAPLNRKAYARVVGPSFCEKQLKKVKTSVNILMNSAIQHEFRTTCDASFTLDDIDAISKGLTGKLYLQAVRMGEAKVPSDLSDKIQSWKKHAEKTLYNRLDILLRE